MPVVRSLLPLLFISAAVVSFPQEKKLAKLEGRVVNSVTGEPVRKAKLSISPAKLRSHRRPARNRMRPATSSSQTSNRAPTG